MNILAEKKEKRYVSDNAQLMAEWEWEKNNELNFDPKSLALGSGQKAWWKCRKGHVWKAKIYHRSNGSGCPYCSGRVAIKGENDLQTVNPIVAKEWNYEKNNGLTPADVMPNSNKKVWWKCEKGHEWQASIADRNVGRGCPYCAGKRVLKGYNDLQTVNPALEKEWDYEKNGKLTPVDITSGSNTKVWWKCQKGHEWQASIVDRNSGNGCPYCAGKKVLKGFNDLLTVNPIIAKEWNYEKNNGLTPADVMPNSNKKVWWKCEKGHEWQASIADRNVGRGCPYCAGKRVLKGYNDLQTVNPALAKEWDYEKNGKLTPADITSGSDTKVWWKCQKGHEWQTTIYHRNNGQGCPVCDSERHTSFPEYAIVYYLKKYGLEVIHSHKEYGYELDVYIPSLKIAIEYDGGYWHRGKVKKDLEKNQKCVKDGITLYRIREGLPALNDSSIDYIVHDAQKDLTRILEKILAEIIGTSVDINLIRDAIDIENLRVYTEKDNSLLFSNPKIAKDWNCEKNGCLKPEYIAANSNKKVWWKCNKGHEWQATIASRNSGCGCPYCAGQKTLKGENDLQTVNPTLAKEWGYEKNNGLTPADVMPNSNKKVWWKCEKGHEWQATIAHRNNGRKCPYCTGRKVLKGYNDLQTINPTLANEWHYENNNGLTPADVTPNSDKKVWWKCEKGHEWQAKIYHRNNGSGCPVCYKEKIKR